MMIIDNVFVIWTVELFLLIYVSSVANNVRLNKDDNLYTKWTDKMESINDEPDGYFTKIAKNLFGNIFKKFPNVNTAKEPPPVKTYDKFAGFVSDITLTLQTCFLFLAIFTIIYLFYLLVKRFFLKHFQLRTFLRKSKL